MVFETMAGKKTHIKVTCCLHKNANKLGSELPARVICWQLCLKKPLITLTSKPSICSANKKTTLHRLHQLTVLRVFLKKINSPKKLDVCVGKVRFKIKRAKHDHLINFETSQIHSFKSQLLQKLRVQIFNEILESDEYGI